MYNNLQTALHNAHLQDHIAQPLVLLVFGGGYISRQLYLPLVMYLLQSKMLLMSCHSICRQRCVGSHMCYSNIKPLSTFHMGGGLSCLSTDAKLLKLGDNLGITWGTFGLFKPHFSFHIGALFCLFVRCQPSKLEDNFGTDNEK